MRGWAWGESLSSVGTGEVSDGGGGSAAALSEGRKAFVTDVCVGRGATWVLAFSFKRRGHRWTLCT